MNTDRNSRLLYDTIITPDREIKLLLTSHVLAAVDLQGSL